MMKIPKLGPARRSVPSGTPGKRVYAIGDIHGCYDLLRELICHIEADNAQRPAKDVRLVFLGDIIDRGPDSRHVIEYLRHDMAKRLQCHFVMGNHEDILIRALQNEPRLLRPWLNQGGFAFAESYGMPKAELDIGNEEDILTLLRAAVPHDDIRFLAGFHDYIRFGDYLFVHAGIRPGLALACQSPQDMRWIREPFLESRKDFGFVVVHGHTVSQEVVVRSNRIGLDTGAYRSDVLSAMMIDEGERHFLQT